MNVTSLFRTALLSGALLGGSLSGWADKATIDDIDFHEAGGNYYCYPWLHQTPPAQTPAPKGYVPFHLEHSGRHGSRWLIGYHQYDKSLELLEKGERNGKLTPLGQQVLDEVRKIRKAAEGREGELSDNGALQHQGIGRRMVQNFPEIFTPETNLDARSTNVIRSILSMFNGLNGIQSEVPTIHIKSDASMADMWYMNYDDKEAWEARKHADENEAADFYRRHDNKGEYLSRLFNDPQFAQDSIGSALFKPLYSVLVNTQSHSDQPWLVEDVFTIDEARERWSERNVNWFMHAGNSKLTGNRMPYTQSNLLHDIIACVDTAAVADKPSVNLRYSHDTVVLPLASLMEMNNIGDEINDLEDLAAQGWHDYQVVPMAGNIQIIFYRKKGSKNVDDVIFKALLNEQEVTLPFKPVYGPYYRWKDAKEYYSKKIAPYLTKK